MAQRLLDGLGMWAALTMITSLGMGRVRISSRKVSPSWSGMCIQAVFPQHRRLTASHWPCAYVPEGFLL